MDAINSVILPPTEAHLLLTRYLLLVTAFAHFSYMGLVIGGSLFSVFFNIVDRDTPHPDARTLSRYLIDLALGNVGLFIFLGLLPLVTLVVLYAQILYRTPQLATIGIASAFILVAAAFVLLTLYRRTFAIRDDNYPLHIGLGGSGLGLLLAAYYIVISGISLTVDPEKWPIIMNAAEYLVYSWNNVARFVLYLVVSFAITGTAVLFFYFRWPEERKVHEQSYNSLLRNFATGLAFGSLLLLPVLMFWNLITIPNVAKSITYYGLSAAAIFLLALGARSVYRLLVHPEQQPGTYPFGVVLAFFLVFLWADTVARANAMRDHLAGLEYHAAQERIKRETELEALLAQGRQSEGGGEFAAPAMEGDAAKGKSVAELNGCIACHSIDGTKLVGPTWKGIYGHETVVEEDGQTKTITVDDAYIARSIKDPNAQVVQGFQPVMPPQANLADADIASIIAYIKTLE